MPFVYIIQSQKDNSYYIGSTSDLHKRLDDHNSGITIYTKKKMPWKIVYYEELMSMSEAKKREYFLKRQRN